MRRPKFPIPLSILFFLAVVLGGTYFARQRILERTLLAAMRMDDVEMARDLVASWPSPAGARNRYGETALYWAVDRDDNVTAALLLDHGADMNARDTGLRDGMEGDELLVEGRGHYCEWMVWRWMRGKTPLHVAIVLERWNLAGLLVSRGADVNVRIRGPAPAHIEWSFGRTPLEMAACTAPPEFVEYLIRAGARVSDRGADRDCPLIRACGRPEVMAVLLDYGADIEQSDPADLDGRRAIHCAARHIGDADSLRLLLERRAQVDARDARGNTPLHLAAEAGAADCAEALLDHGADVAARNGEGRTPLMVAETAYPANPSDHVQVEAGRRVIAGLLRARGAAR